MERLGQVDQVEDILLETRSTETDRGLQELVTHSGVLSDGKGDLVNGSTSSLANGREGVDGRDSLSQHGVGGKLGKLGRPETDGQDSLFGNPVLVDGLERVAGVDTRLALERTDEDSVGGEQVVNGGTLSQELCEVSGNSSCMGPS